MRRPGDLEVSTLRGDGEARGEGMDLVVVADGFVTRASLPTAGSITIGRSSRADVVVDLPKVSREHVRIAIEDARVTIEDLGSANGTSLAGRSLEPGRVAPLSVGDVVEMGSARLLLVAAEAQAGRSRVFAHSRFDAALEAACARARGGEGDVLLVRVRPSDARAGRSNALAAILEEVAGASGVVGAYGPDELELALVDRDEASLEHRLEHLRERLRAARLPVTLGAALFRRDGWTGAELMTKACDAMLGPKPAPAPFLATRGPMVEVYALADRIARADAPCLVVGETGTGKEIVAARIHALTPRRNERRLVQITCAALPETNVEVELFGPNGLLRRARGGTVLLDEIGEMPARLQAKLLRVVEEGELHSGGVGAHDRVDVRFIAITSKDLEVEVSQGRFRADLFYRLGAMTIVVPPLRARRGEILELARTFAADASLAQGLPRPPSIGQEAAMLLERHAWPGNVRELRNVMTRAVLLAGAATIRLEHLPVKTLSAPVPASPAPHGADVPGERLSEGVARVERDRILSALAEANGNQTRAAKVLGISRGKLVQRITEYGIPRPRKDRA